MDTLLVVAPILPGKRDTFQKVMKDFDGPRNAEFKALLKKGGVSRVRAWIQPTPQGELAVVLHEGPDPQRWLPTATESTEPAAEWFRGWAAEVHGMKFDGEPPPMPESVVDFSTD